MNFDRFVRFVINNASKITSWSVLHRDIGLTIIHVRINEITQAFYIPTPIIRKNQAMLDSLRDLALDSIWLNHKRKIFVEGYLK